MSESQIESLILKWLKLFKVFAWNKKSHIKSTSNMSGESDIIGIYQGKFLAIEVKNDDG